MYTALSNPRAVSWLVFIPLHFGKADVTVWGKKKTEMAMERERTRTQVYRTMKKKLNPGQ